MNSARFEAGAAAELAALRAEVARLSAELEAANALIAADEVLRANLFVQMRAANEQLLLNSLRMTATLDAAETGTFRWDVNAGAIASDAGFARSSHDNGLILNATFSKFLEGVHPDDRGALRSRFMECALGLGEVTCEFRSVSGGGHTHWWSVRGQLATELEDSVTVSGVFSDVTARKAADTHRAQHAMSHEVERRYRVFADGMPQLLWTASAAGRWTYANRRWFEYTGLSVVRSYHEGLSAALSDEDSGEILSKWRSSVQNGSPFYVQTRLRRHDGLSRRFLLEATPLCDEQGAVVSWFGSCTDIEYDKQDEDQLEHIRKAKGEFLAMLTHELRSPVADIATAMKSVRSKTKETALAECAAADLQLDYLTRLLDELLDAARVARGKVVLRRAWLPVADVFSEATQDVFTLMESRGHLLEVAIEREDMLVYADAPRLRQVLSNLLRNAAQYTPDGGLIRLSARADGDRLTVEVTDNGVGMSARLCAKVFDLFVQGDRTRDRSQGGLGIGLTLARSLVHLHEGSIAATSDGVGCGSVFSLTLPLPPR